MKLCDIVKARTTLLNAGTTADRNQLRATLLAHLAKDVEMLGEQMATVRADYRRKLERWRTQDVPENVWVSALPSDVHDSRLYRVTGVIALFCEMALAAWIFDWLGVGWWMGVVTALGIVWSQLTFQEQELLLPKLLSVMPTWHCWKDISLRLWLQILFEKAGLQF